LTTGKPAKIISKIGPNRPAHYIELKLDTRKNVPEIIKEEERQWKKDHGTRIEIDLEGTYQKGSQSVDEYLKQTAITNPHATIIYTNPKAEQIIFPRATDKLPPETKEIKPHPYGVELGVMQRMLKDTEARSLQSFLQKEFSRVGSETAKQICKNGALPPATKPEAMTRDRVEQLMKGVKNTKIINPPTDCIAPIGALALEKGLKKEINAEFYTAVTRSPQVYRGNPFLIEVGLAYGGDQTSEGTIKILRFANRVPLLYQQGGCSTTKSIIKMNWRQYGLSQSSGALPVGPVTVLVHIASVWVPFTSESKEAIAHYPEIIKEIRLALQDCARKLAVYVRKKKRISEEGKKRSYIEKYLPHVAAALKELLDLKKTEEEQIKENLIEMLEKHRGKIVDIKHENLEYDEEFANIGKAEAEDE